MARNLQRRQQHVHENLVGDSLTFAPPGGGGGGGGAPSFAAPMMSEPMGFRDIEETEVAAKGALSRSTRHGHSISFGGGVEELAREPVAAVVLLRSRPGSAGGPSILPGLRDSRALIREQDLSNQPQGDRWNAEVSAELHNGYANTSNTSISTSVSSRGAYRQTHNEAGGPWNSLGHRRVHSAPNIMEGMKSKLSSSGSARWRSSALPPWLASDAISPGLREHAIPEGRRFEALEPPVQSSGVVPDRPRSWRARTAAPPWGAGAPSMEDFGQRDPSALEWAPKLKASYFVDVRGGGGLDGDEKNASTSAGGKIIPQITTIAGMAADTRPFEEIKRMRLSQALESAPSEGTMLGLTPSPTYSASGMAHFDNSRVAPRFSPGKGVKVPGFNCRPSFSGGGVGVRDGGFGWQPLSPALTEPPTPPPRPDWKAPPDAAEASSPRVGGDGQVRRQPSTAESEQGVLPMEQRPLDEVDAVQALMSVGRGTRAQAEGMPVLEQGGDCGGQGAADNSEAVDMSEASYPSVPSLERLKPFEGGDDDDDGLDKDLWVVVEKGSLCASSDCVYRDAAARIASRRHYHSKCTHTHNGGVKKGMVFHHHQLEKVQKHQRSHKREATKSAPYKRTTPEDHQAMEGAGVEGYRPEDWGPEETRQLDELVNQLVAPVTHAWPSIARFFPTKSGIQCLLHWRFTLNGNGIIRGNGTWGAEEDARLRKLAPVFSSPATGPRWAKIAEVMPGRTAKQCRERYNNHVDPAIKKDKIWTAEEDALVMQLHAEHHNQFAKIARRIPGRCYDDVKNRFNLLVKRRQLAGKPSNSAVSSTAGSSCNNDHTRSAVDGGHGSADQRQVQQQVRHSHPHPHPAAMMLSREGHHNNRFLPAPSNARQAPLPLLTPRSGMKRSTPGMSGGGPGMSGGRDRLCSRES